MDILKIASVAIVTCFLTVILKQYKPEYAVAAAICGGIIIFLAAAPKIAQVLAVGKNLADKTGIGREMIAPAVKVIGISYLTGYAAEMCRDAGENALAVKLEMAGKIIMLTVAVPVIEAMLDTIERILP